MPRFFALTFLAVLFVSGATGPTRVMARAVPVAPRAARARPDTAASPARLIIPAIGLSEPLVAVGLDAYNRPIVPKHNVGWYLWSAQPGQGENVVMWAHVLRWKDSPRIPAAFENLKALRIGNTVSVALSNGRVYRYRVSQKIWARPNDIAHILPTGSERLTLVSCIGDNVIVNRTLTKKYRLITIATSLR